MKKIVVAFMMVAVVFMTAGQNNNAEARDVYCGTYRDGNEAYLMTETIRTNDSELYCTVKAVKGRNLFYINYKFSPGRGIWYSNSQGFSGECDQYKTPIAWRIWSEASKYW